MRGPGNACVVQQCWVMWLYLADVSASGAGVIASAEDTYSARRAAKRTHCDEPDAARSADEPRRPASARAPLGQEGAGGGGEERRKGKDRKTYGGRRAQRGSTLADDGRAQQANGATPSLGVEGHGRGDILHAQNLFRVDTLAPCAHHLLSVVPCGVGINARLRLAKSWGAAQASEQCLMLRVCAR
ncbi:hypothetical protein FB451DRAFT_1447114 [Mycena latifolia]|nr:hypothetical protein FB451DRAFT_1447114 [Mycena latifolia]